MKLKCVFILIALIYTCNIEGQDKTITIKNGITLNEIKSDTKNHRDKDVEIIRTKSDSTDLYVVILYREEDGKLKQFKDFIINSKNLYDRATYEWIDGSTLKFKIFNSVSGQSESFTQTGCGGGATLQRENNK